MADLSKPLRTMKRILILLLALMPFAMTAQELTKEEKKALKAELKAERKEQKRIEDSIWRASIAERQRQIEEERKRSKSTSLVIITPFESQKDVFDALVHKLMQDGIVPSLIDKEYYIIKTPRKQVSVGTYDITFTVFKVKGLVCVRGAGMGYGSFGISSGMFRSEQEMIVPLEYGSVEGSTAKTAWNEIEKYLLNITHLETIYELPE